MRRIVVDAHEPDATLLKDAAAVIRAGGIVAIPTDTLYGLAADPFSTGAVARVFAVKGRSAARAMPLVAADLAQVVSAVGPLADMAHRLASVYWPGPLTLLVRRPATLPSEVTGGSDQVGVRVPAHAVARGLCAAFGRLLTATSANRSGEPPSGDPAVVARAFDAPGTSDAGEGIDLLVDAGPTPGGAPSTIVDVSGTHVRLVRPGAIPWEDVQACLKQA